MIAQGERLLRAGPKSYSVGLDVSNGRMRLHREVLHTWKSESVLKNMICLFKSFLHVTVSVTEAITEIGSGKLLRGFVMLPHHFTATRRRVMHQGCAGRQ